MFLSGSYKMPRPRATAKQLKTSGLLKRNPSYYDNYNLTEAVPVKATAIEPVKSWETETKAAFSTTTVPLLQMKALSETDLVQLRNLFDIYNEIVLAKRAIKKFDKDNPDYLEDLKKIQARRTLNAWFNTTTQTFIKLAGDYGLTPVARTRLGHTEDVKDEDPLDVILQG